MSDSASRSTILVVDDDTHVRDALRPYLADAGFAVVEAATLAEGREAFVKVTPQLVVLDLRLPDGNGLDFCRELRSTSRVPVLMLTSVGDPIDRIVGLELGADDYVAKPFVPREVAARVEAVLRRSSAVQARRDPTVLRVGALEVDPRERVVRVDGDLVSTTPTEFRILAMLAADPGRAFSRRELLESLEGGSQPESIDRHLTSLRRKLEAAGHGTTTIEAVYGVGYKLVKPTPDD